MKIKSQSPETDEPYTLSVPFAGSLAGLGPNASYAAARRGEIPTIRFGKKLRVPRKKYLQMLLGEIGEVALSQEPNVDDVATKIDLRTQQSPRSQERREDEPQSPRALSDAHLHAAKSRASRR